MQMKFMETLETLPEEVQNEIVERAYEAVVKKTINDQNAVLLNLRMEKEFSLRYLPNSTDNRHSYIKINELTWKSAYESIKS